MPEIQNYRVKSSPNGGFPVLDLHHGGDGNRSDGGRRLYFHHLYAGPGQRGLGNANVVKCVFHVCSVAGV